MMTEQCDIEDYEQEKADMHAQLQALKDAAESGDPDFQKKLDNLVETTSTWLLYTTPSPRDY